jgi:hypothetical protein
MAAVEIHLDSRFTIEYVISRPEPTHCEDLAGTCNTSAAATCLLSQTNDGGDPSAGQHSAYTAAPVLKTIGFGTGQEAWVGQLDLRSRTAFRSEETALPETCTLKQILEVGSRLPSGARVAWASFRTMSRSCPLPSINALC